MQADHIETNADLIEEFDRTCVKEKNSPFTFTESKHSCFRVD